MAGQGAYALTSGGVAPSPPATHPGRGFIATGGVRGPQKPGKPPAPKGKAGPGKPKGPAPLPTDPLAPLTPQQIRAQATKTITRAYAPNVTDLNSQSTQATNLYHTQQADDAAFNQWLTSSAQAIQSQTDTVNQKLAGIIDNLRSSSTDSLNQGVRQGAASLAQPGNSASVLQTAAANGAAPAINAVGNEGTQQGIHMASSEMGANNMMAGASEVATGRVEQERAMQFGALNKTLNSIAQERTKLMAARTGDIAKEIARLNGIEISKAQFRTNQAALEQKLGISQQVANTGATNAATNQTNANTRALAQQETAAHNAVMEGINRTHYANADAHAQAVQQETARHNKVMEGIGQQNATTAANRAANGGGSAPAKLGTYAPGKYATPAQQNATSTTLRQIQQALIWDIEKYHKGQPNALSLAWHDLMNGNYEAAFHTKVTYNADGTVQSTTPGPHVPTSWDPILVNAATNALTQYGGGGLTPGDVSSLQSAFGLNVQGRYPVKSQSQPSRPGAG